MDGLKDIIEQCRASQNKEELTALLTDVSKIKPKVILEIGSWRGWLIETFFEAFHPEWLRGVEVDRANIDPEMHDQFPIMIADSHLEATRDKILEDLEGRKVDFLFIDGDHSYEGVKRDFELYAPLVRDGGIIGFHDASLLGHPDVHVYKLWNEISNKYRSKLVTFGTDEGLSLQSKGTGTGWLIYDSK